MRTVAIIQARMTSSRLPGKVLADLCGKPLLACMVDRVREARSLDAIVIATTTNATDDRVAVLARELGIDSFRGDENDVLSRYAGAAEAANADVIVRLTADCPMIDPVLIDEAVGTFDSGEYDYLSNAIVATFPDGMDVEVCSRAALEAANAQANLPFHREHVTPYLRTGHYGDIPTGDFRVGELRAPADFSHVRLTVDTAADLARVRSLLAILPAGYGWMDVLSLIVRRPELMSGRATAAPPELRRVAEGDARLLYDWVNQPESLATKLWTRDAIDWKTHLAWFHERLTDPDTAIWIAEREGVPIGQLRVQRRQAGLEIDVFVVAEARGGGVASHMIETAAAACAKTWPGVPLVARVRPDNWASRRLFARTGFGATRVMPDHLMMVREQPVTAAAHA